MNLFNENVGLYFYSAVLQGNMALLALVGVFAIYKLQQVSNKLEKVDNTIGSFFKEECEQHQMYSLLKLNFNDIKELLASLDRSVNDSQASIHDKRFIQQKLDHAKTDILYREKLLEKQKRIKKGIENPFMTIFAVIVMSFPLLVFASDIHCWSVCVELSFFTLIVVLNVFGLFLNRKYIFEVLED